MSDEFEEEIVSVSRTRKIKRNPQARIVSATKKPLDKRFDAAKASMPVPAKRIQLNPSVRKQGCPNGGRVRVSQMRIDALDKVTYETKLARTLGIGRGTLAQWIDAEQTKNPLPYVVEDGHRLFRKDIVTKWLMDTGRHPSKD